MGASRLEVVLGWVWRVVRRGSWMVSAMVLAGWSGAALVSASGMAVVVLAGCGCSSCVFAASTVTLAWASAGCCGGAGVCGGSWRGRRRVVVTLVSAEIARCWFWWSAVVWSEPTLLDLGFPW